VGALERGDRIRVPLALALPVARATLALGGTATFAQNAAMPAPRGGIGRVATESATATGYDSEWKTNEDGHRQRERQCCSEPRGRHERLLEIKRTGDGSRARPIWRMVAQ